MQNMGARSPAEVEKFLSSAAVGESLVYAWGEEFPRSAPAAAVVRRLIDAGVVTAVARRSDGRKEYVMRVLAKRQAKPISASEIKDSEYPKPETVILQALRRAANGKRPCPSNDELARRAQLPDVQAASYIVRKLRTAGKIRVEFIGPRQRRQITIVSTGAQTDLAVQ